MPAADQIIGHNYRPATAVAATALTATALTATAVTATAVRHRDGAGVDTRISGGVGRGSRMKFLVAMFIGVPVVEMLILIEVGGVIGALPTVALVVLTATIGVWLLRLEGLATMQRVQARMARGEIPETELLEGAMLLVGGALLLTPGFVTDAIGFVCLVPILRRPVARFLIARIQARVSVVGPGFRRPDQQDGVIDGEFTVHPDQKDDKNALPPR